MHHTPLPGLEAMHQDCCFQCHACVFVIFIVIICHAYVDLTHVLCASGTERPQCAFLKIIYIGYMQSTYVRRATSYVFAELCFVTIGFLPQVGAGVPRVMLDSSQR